MISALEIDVLPAGELGIEAGAQFQQRGDAAVDDDRSGRGLEDAADQLQQGALAGAVAADDADRFAAPDVEGDILQRGEFPVVVRRPKLRNCLTRSPGWPNSR
jgi:hypothetical protein